VTGALVAMLLAAGTQPPRLPTPNAERVLSIGVLDKVSSETKLLTLKPGHFTRFGKLRIIARTCAASPPWEKPHTGAFLQIDGPTAKSGKRARLFSGWLFAESPSLNSFDHPRYDVWVRSCTMRFPETGPDTIVVGASPKPAAASSAPKSAPASETAPDSN
jgi:hypothetical protein